MSKIIYMVAGAKPNFMKVAPIIKQFIKHNIKYKLIHTGQNHDHNMSKVFLKSLDIF